MDELGRPERSNTLWPAKKPQPYKRTAWTTAKMTVNRRFGSRSSVFMDVLKQAQRQGQ